MNADERNVSMDQQQAVYQETASQMEELSQAGDSTITSGLQAGINYCRSMADQMVDEMRYLQEHYDSTRQTNRVLKQNLVDLENEKQKLIADFQEDFRKFNSLNSQVKGLEEEILCLKEFLDPSVKLEADVTQTRIEELKIRSSVLQAPLEEQEIRLQKIESSVLDLITDLKEKANKVEVFNAELEIFSNIGKRVISHIDHFDSEIRDRASIEDFSENEEELKSIICSLQEQCSIQATDAQNKRAEMYMQIKMEFDVLRSWEVFQKDKIRNDSTVKQRTLDDLKVKTLDKLNQSAELYRKIKTEEDAIKNLEYQIELLRNELRCFENKLLPLEEEKLKIHEFLNGLLQEIQRLKEEENSVTEEKETLQKNIEQLKIKDETLQKNVESVRDRVELNNKLTEIKLVKDSSQEEKVRLDDEKQQLLVEKENFDSENANLIREVSAETKRFSEQQNILQKNEISPASNDENEAELIDQLRSIKTEEYSLIDLKDVEFDKLADKFQQIFSDFTDLEFSLSQVELDNTQVAEEIPAGQKSLKIIDQDNEFLKSSIQRIKQNVYNGTFVTMQELSKRYNMMVNGKNVETERVDKLKKEIANLKARLNSKSESTRAGVSDSFVSDSDFSAKGKKCKT